MGKFTNWMMGMDNGDEDYGKSKRNRNDGGDNNFDRFVENNRRDEAPQYREERPTYSRDEYPAYRDEAPQYRDERVSYVEPRVEYSRQPDTAKHTSTIPLMGGDNGGSVQNVVLYSPRSFQDVQTLIDFLKAREPSVVDLAGVKDSSAQRILDFLSGAIYALSGSIHRISGTIFLLTPSGVTLTVPNDVKRKLEGK